MIISRKTDHSTTSFKISDGSKPTGNPIQTIITDLPQEDNLDENIYLFSTLNNRRSTKKRRSYDTIDVITKTILKHKVLLQPSRGEKRDSESTSKP